MDDVVHYMLKREGVSRYRRFTLSITISMIAKYLTIMWDKIIINVGY